MRIFIKILLGGILLSLATGNVAADLPFFSIEPFRYKILSEEDRTVAISDDGSSEWKSISEAVLPSEIEYEGVNYTVTKIEYFSGCPKLRSITIPLSVTEIDIFAFAGDYNLINFIVPENHPLFSSEEGMLLNKDKTKLLFYPSASGEVEVEEGIEEIGTFAFGETKVQKVTLPKSTKLIEGAFWGCDYLRNLTILSPPPVLDSKFENTSVPLFWDLGGSDGMHPTLTTIYVPKEYYIAYIESSNWRNFSKLYPIGGPSLGELFSHGDFIFECTGKFRVGVVRLTDEMKGQTEDFELSIPSKVDYEGIPYNVTSISEYAFYGHTKLRSIKLPYSFESIGENAFYGCSNLTKIELPSANTLCNGAFSRTGLKEFTVPANLRNIYGNPFAETEIVFNIGINQPYFGVDIDNALCSKDMNILYSWPTASGEIRIPERVTEINDSAFYANKKVTSVSFSDKIQRIRENAFGKCDNLRIVKCYAEYPPRLESDAFPASSDLVIYVPENSLADYLVSNWSRYNLKGMDIDGVENVIQDAANPEIKVVGDRLYLSDSGKKDLIQIYSTSGALILSSPSSEEGIDISNLPVGVYIVKAGNFSAKFVR